MKVSKYPSRHNCRGRSIKRGIPVAPIRLNAVNRCARSAHTLPLTNTRSNVVTCASRALFAAALNLLTFSWGVSPGGPGFRGGRFDVFEAVLVDGGSLADAWGVVDVKRVASVADRGMVVADCILDTWG